MWPLLGLGLQFLKSNYLTFIMKKVLLFSFFFFFLPFQLKIHLDSNLNSSLLIRKSVHSLPCSTSIRFVGYTLMNGLYIKKIKFGEMEWKCGGEKTWNFSTFEQLFFIPQFIAPRKIFSSLLLWSWQHARPCF